MSSTIQVTWRESHLPLEATLLTRCKYIVGIRSVVENESLQELRFCEERIIVIFTLGRRSDYSHVPKNRSTSAARGDRVGREGPARVLVW